MSKRFFKEMDVLIDTLGDWRKGSIAMKGEVGHKNDPTLKQRGVSKSEKTN